MTILNPDDQAGEIPGHGSRVRVHYIGMLANGKEFDNSHNRKKPFEFVVGQGTAIQCWEDAFKEIRYG